MENIYDEIMQKISESLEAFLCIQEGKPTTQLERYLRVIDFCKANFSSDVCKIICDDPEEKLRQHMLTIEWKEDLFQEKLKGKIIALLFLVDEFFQVADRDGNISWNMYFYNTYEE